tara:strand:- start:5899 stop:7098 length:1200 start_codon:yes stop_codon:yes gene_type:complete
MSSEKSFPLQGIKVVDVGTLFAGPWIATYMADFGADVVKIEHPKGDSLRNFASKKNGISLWWKFAGRNKKSVTCNISTKKGQEILKNLCKSSDVLVENFRPGTLEKWNLSFKELHKINPKLILVRTSGFGQKGKYSRRPGFGTLAEAMSGFAHITGNPESTPTLPSIPLADGISALCGTYAVMMALYHRDVHNTSGQEIDVSIYEPITHLLGPQSLEYDQLGKIQERTGNTIPFSAPRNTYKCKDGRYVAISCSTDSIFKRTMEAVGRKDLAEDKRMSTQEGRVLNMKELDKAIQDWIKIHTLEETIQHFAKHESALAPVNDIAQLMSDPHVKERGTFAEIEDEELGKIKMPNIIPQLSESPGKIRWAGPPKGKHTEEVLLKLGYSKADLKKFSDSKII